HRPVRGCGGDVHRRGMAGGGGLRDPDGGAAGPPHRPVRSDREMIDLLGYGAFFLSTALVFAIITLGLNLQWGLTGLFNVGIAGFVAIGAYTSAILTTPDTAERIGGFGWPILAGWLSAVVLTAGAAAFTGFATLRLKSDYLAITTFGVAVVVQLAALNAVGLTGGPFGVAFIPRPFAGLQSDPLAFNLVNLGIIAAVTLACYLAL